MIFFNYFYNYFTLLRLCYYYVTLLCYVYSLVIIALFKCGFLKFCCNWVDWLRFRILLILVYTLLCVSWPNMNQYHTCVPAYMCSGIVLLAVSFHFASCFVIGLSQLTCIFLLYYISFTSLASTGVSCVFSFIVVLPLFLISKLPFWSARSLTFFREEGSVVIWD